MFTVQDKQRQEVLESRILALEDKERELKTHLADKESQLEEAFAGMNKKHQETMAANQHSFPCSIKPLKVFLKLDLISPL